MALEIFVGQTAMPTDAVGTTDLTSGDSATTPVAALHAKTKGVTNDSVAGDFELCIGMSDGTLSRAMSTTANTGQATDDATKGYYDAAIAGTAAGSQVQDGGVSHNSFISGGQRVNDDVAFGAAHLCQHMFFAGCNVATKEAVLNASVDTAVNVDPGFAWDVAIVTQCRETTLEDEDPDNNGSFGFMVKDDDEQACIAVGTNNGDASPGGPSLQISTTYAGMVINPGTGALIFGIDVQEGSGTSCDVFPRIAGGESVLVAILFIGFTDGASVKRVSWDSPTSGGNNGITGAGGEPVALIHLLSRAAAYDTAEADAEAGAYGVSFITDDSQFCISGLNEFNTGGNSNTWSEPVAQSIKVRRDDGNQGALNSYAATHVSMDANGWTENWTAVEDGGAAKQVSLAFLPATGEDIVIAVPLGPLR